MAAVVFFEQTLENCQSATDRVVLQVFCAEGRVHCEMESACNQVCCALLTPIEASKLAAALSAAAAFSDRTR